MTLDSCHGCMFLIIAIIMINGIEQKFYFKSTDMCNMYPQSVPDVLIGLLYLVEHKILLCCRAARSKFCCSFPFSSSSILTEQKYIYKYKVVIYVCQFVCPIITQEPLDVFASTLIRELVRATEMFFVWF